MLWIARVGDPGVGDPGVGDPRHEKGVEVGKGSKRAARQAQALAALRSSQDEPARLPVGERTESGSTVRSVAASDRVYRCPGCDQEVAGVPHVVAWPVGDPDSRRHWHSPCWTHRGRRAPGVLRGRGAPRH